MMSLSFLESTALVQQSLVINGPARATCTQGGVSRRSVMASLASHNHGSTFNRHPQPPLSSGTRATLSHLTAVAASPADVDAATVATWNEEARRSRLQHLESQALAALRHVIESPFAAPTFPCALIAGDVVMLHLLHRLGALKSGRVKVVFIDTFHLFPETYTFLKECEEAYGFKAEVFQAAGFASKVEYQAVHGSDLFIVDIDEYDRICKVEPFGRALKSLSVDAMINGRRRDHGGDRADLDLFEGFLEASPEGGTKGLVKVQPLAYWEFKDCFEYLDVYGVPKHPLHDKGFPSIGDVQTTLPVPKEKWFAYGGERSGRFQGLQNKDGSDKTECGIHVGDARQVGGPSSSINPPSSSLTPPSSSLTPPSSSFNPPSSTFTPPSSSLTPPSSSLNPQ